MAIKKVGRGSGVGEVLIGEISTPEQTGTAEQGGRKKKQKRKNRRKKKNKEEKKGFRTGMLGI
jgi:hypothetical protein